MPLTDVCCWTIVYVHTYRRMHACIGETFDAVVCGVRAGVETKVQSFGSTAASRPFIWPSLFQDESVHPPAWSRLSKRFAAPRKVMRHHVKNDYQQGCTIYLVSTANVGRPAGMVSNSTCSNCSLGAGRLSYSISQCVLSARERRTERTLYVPSTSLI
jgi:hypothetical protein